MFRREDAPFIFGIISLVAVSVAAFSFFGPRPPEIRRDSYSIRINENDPANNSTYQIGQYAEINGRVLSTSEQDPSYFNLGAGTTLSYLSEEEHQTAQNDYISRGRCAAAFYNSHHKLLMLITDNQEIFSRMRGWDMSQGRKFTLKGNQLRLTSLTYKGQQIGQSFPNMNYLYVSDLQFQ